MIAAMKRFEIKVGDHTIIFANNDGETLAVTVRGPDAVASYNSGIDKEVELDGVSIKDIGAATDKICKQLKALCDTKFDKLTEKFENAFAKSFELYHVEDIGFENKVGYTVSNNGEIVINMLRGHRIILTEDSDFFFEHGNLNVMSKGSRETFFFKKSEKLEF